MTIEKVYITEIETAVLQTFVKAGVLDDSTIKAILQTLIKKLEK